MAVAVGSYFVSARTAANYGDLTICSICFCKVEKEKIKQNITKTGCCAPIDVTSATTDFKMSCLLCSAMLSFPSSLSARSEGKTSEEY